MIMKKSAFQDYWLASIIFTEKKRVLLEDCRFLSKQCFFSGPHTYIICLKHFLIFFIRGNCLSTGSIGDKYNQRYYPKPKSFFGSVGVI